MSLPTHIEEVSPERAAIAPYNFVPLPEQVVAAEPLPTHDRYHPREGEQPRYTGRITCTLTTASPLYVRCGYTPKEYAEYGDKPFHELSPEQKQARALFFHYADPFAPNADKIAPIIPGSSLRGMLRALVEIAGYGKMDKVTDRQLFYRDVRNADYRKAFAGAGAKVGNLPSYISLVHTGFLRKRSSGYVIEECDVARIYSEAGHRHIASIPDRNGVQYQRGQGANFRPDWHFQHQTIYVHVDNVPRSYRFNNKYLEFRAVRQAAWQPQPDFLEGTLVITGHMQNKHMEFVFLHKIIKTHQLHDDLVRRFEDDDQISQWQEQAFPNNGNRQKNGGLSDGEPVFFLLNNDGSVRFFGRAQLFRLPYGTAPFAFVPEIHRNPIVFDIAEAIFGFVRPERQKQDPQAIAGRVFVGDALLQPGQPDVLFAEALTPQILASPKPTTFQHYLVQPNETRAVQQNLHGYNSAPGKTTIRGHKLYWHKGEQPNIGLPPSQIDTNESQKTLIRPVKPGVTFEFTISFENLSAVELGALLWVLDKASDTRYRLKLGMAKPLGCGSVSIQSKLFLSQRTERYQTLFQADVHDWSTGEVEEYQRETYLDAFHTHVLAALKAHDPDRFNRYTKIDETLRIQCLLALLRWEGAPPVESTRYMEIERDATDSNHVIPAARNQQSRRKYLPNGRPIDVINEYSSRPVLPLPIDVYPTQALPQAPAAPTDEPAAAALGTRTMRARVRGVGANDAGVEPLDGGRHGRARFAPDLPRKPRSDDVVLVQLDAEDRPEVIIAFL